ncbi:MAG: hypothetical protein HQL45_17685 [Alphaproteobacteria bacterium]|nr:hypothetical protein [Alphaproteobacteria bacterium]
MLGITASRFQDMSLFGWGRGSAADKLADSRIEPRLTSPETVPPLSPEEKKADETGRTEPDLLMLPAPDERPNVRNMTPRELSEFAYNLYMDGTLSWDEYRMVGFPSELHPDYDRTIGSLTGETAQPDRPKDMVIAWQERVAFEERHSADQPDQIERARRVLDVLRWQELPPVRLEV